MLIAILFLQFPIGAQSVNYFVWPGERVGLDQLLLLPYSLCSCYCYWLPDLD